MAVNPVVVIVIVVPDVTAVVPTTAAPATVHPSVSSNGEVTDSLNTRSIELSAVLVAETIVGGVKSSSSARKSSKCQLGLTCLLSGPPIALFPPIPKPHVPTTPSCAVSVAMILDTPSTNTS